MRSLLISLLVVLLAAAIQAEVFKKEKVKLGKKTCLCDFDIETGNPCSGSAKCDKKCSGSGTVELGGCSFTLAVKKGKGKISKCSCEAATVVVPTEPTTGSGSGETPVPITGSGSGETPVPITGSGSGGQPPAGGEGMQCSCKCNCPDGSGECDCDCNCPMTSKALTCAPGFSKVCPMMGDMCPQDMDPVCPYNAMSRMAGSAAYEGMDKGCQCVPDFLLDMVMIQPAARMEAVDRAMTKATIQVGKKKCKCSYEMNAENCKKSKIVCDKKCSGKATVELSDGDVMYMVDIAIKKGKVTIAKCDVDAPEPTGTGGGSTGSGSGNVGGGVGGMGSRCSCVSKGIDGSGPTLPPTGSGSGPTIATIPPTGSGSEPAPPTGSGSEPPTGSGSGSGSSGYSQAWLRGEGPYGHVHEGVRLEAGDGWVGVGDLIQEESRPKKTQVMVRRIDNAGKTVWTYKVGDSHTNAAKMSYSAGYSIAQSGDKLYVGGGIWQKQSNIMKPAVIALDVATGSVVWTKLLDSQPKNGGVRSLVVDGGRLICTGYVNYGEAGFVFVADEATPAVWELDTSGNLVTEKLLSVAGLGQGAKIRKDTTGYIMTSTAWSEISGQELNHAALVKLSDSLDVEWSKMFGMAGGDSQVFDMLVDKEGNYLLGGHTTVGSGVVNWDYLALKVNRQTRDVEWRRTFGQPRGFDAKFIHDEMYGVAMDPAGNYLLLGGSGDEYSYSATDSSTGWMSDVWVSYLVVVDTNGSTLSEGVFGRKGGNNAGEWLSVDEATGEVMIYTDSDTDGGFGFLKLTPN